MPGLRVAIVLIVSRVMVSHFSHSRGFCGMASSAISVPPQIEQRPSWASISRRVVLLIGRVALRRRLAQYSTRAGSSGDAVPMTIWCRRILVQENLCM